MNQAVAVEAALIEADKRHADGVRLYEAGDKGAAQGALAGLANELEDLMQAAEILQSEIDWRKSSADLAQKLREYDESIANTIGMRMQERLTSEQAESIATCRAVHKDLTLHF